MQLRSLSIGVASTARSVAFGVDADDQPGSQLMILRPYHSQVASFVPVSDAQRQAIEGLLAREYDGERDSVAGALEGGAQICAYRSRVTGGIYVVPGTQDTAAIRIEGVLESAVSPRDVVSTDIYPVEDWRDGMLLIGGNGEWHDTTMYQRYAYYDYMMRVPAGEPREVMYVNNAFQEKCKQKGISIPLVIVIPDHFFPRPSSIERMMKTIISSGPEPVGITVKRLKGHASELSFRREDVPKTADNVRVLGRLDIVMPESIVQGSKWDHRVVMTRHRARMVLGVRLESPSLEDVRAQFETEVGKLVPAIRRGDMTPYEFDDARCLALRQAAKVLQPSGAFTCDKAEAARRKFAEHTIADGDGEKVLS